MKNEHIKSLKEVIPAEIRLEVYKEALNCIKNNINISGMGSYGLCMVFPCLLWGLDDYVNRTPTGDTWSFFDTKRAFPELTNEVIDKIELQQELIDRNKLRIRYLKQFIKKLS
jgi:hypothetical protein